MAWNGVWRNIDEGIVVQIHQYDNSIYVTIPDNLKTITVLAEFPNEDLNKIKEIDFQCRDCKIRLRNANKRMTIMYITADGESQFPLTLLV